MVRSLWSVLSVKSPDEARTLLGKREGIRTSNVEKFVGVWHAGTTQSDEVSQTIGQWGTRLALDSVVWTALPPKFKGEQERIPTAEEVLGHLLSLPHEKRRDAEEYVRKAPRQIDTDYRRRIEAELDWKPATA